MQTRRQSLRPLPRPSAAEHALLVPPDDPQALAAAAVAVLKSPEASLQRVKAASARFGEYFTIDGCADGMVRFYEAALS